MATNIELLDHGGHVLTRFSAGEAGRRRGEPCGYQLNFRGTYHVFGSVAELHLYVRRLAHATLELTGVPFDPPLPSAPETPPGED
jgi:hypothetical protein